MTDVFTRFAPAVPTMDQRASTVAKVLVTEWFVTFGRPFEGEVFRKLFNIYGISKSRTTA